MVRHRPVQLIGGTRSQRIRHCIHIISLSMECLDDVLIYTNNDISFTKFVSVRV